MGRPETVVAGPVELVTVWRTENDLWLLGRPLFGLYDALTFLRVVNGPKVAVLALLDDGLVDKVAELGLHLAGVGRLLLNLGQLLLHLSEPSKLSFGFKLLALLFSFVSPNLSLGSTTNTGGFH